MSYSDDEQHKLEGLRSAWAQMVASIPRLQARADAATGRARFELLDEVEWVKFEVVELRSMIETIETRRAA